jgi:hypothetical protein
MFFCAAELQALVMTTWVNRAYDVMVVITSLNPEITVSNFLKTVGQLVGLALWQLGIIASLSFMWSVRNPKTE